MELVFVDDTKQKGLRKGMGQLTALAAVAFPEAGIAAYAESVAATYATHGVPPDSELKWSTPKGSWFKTSEGAAALTPVREECITAAIDVGARAVVVVFDLGRTSLQGSAAEARVLEFLFERISMMLASGERALMICDKPAGGHKDEDNWIAGTLQLTGTGTTYVKPGAVVLPILTAPSHHHPHLQFADLVGGAITAAVAGVRYGVDLMPRLTPLLHTNIRGEIAGTGLKLFPDDLINVYHWVLGSNAYSRGRAGIAIPSPRLPYSDDDGIGLVAGLRSKHISKRVGGDG